jgi:nucleolar protein 4
MTSKGTDQMRIRFFLPPIFPFSSSFPPLVIFPNTPAAATLAPNELEKRTDSFNSRKTLLTSNPSLYISKTRLSIRQLPLFCTDRTLKRLAIHASREFDNEVKAGTREGLDEEESRDGTLSPAVAKAEESGKGGKNKGKKERTTVVIQAKVVRANDRVDALSGLGKSKGYGFLEMRTHQDALKVLRWANNNPTVENLMREWWTVELAEVIERTKGELDEARLAELKIASGEIPAPKEPEDEGPMNEKKKKKGKAKAEAEEAEKDGEVGEKKKSQKKEKVELAELETRLRRLTEKAKELKELMDAGREVVMKKTLIVEFSIENVQVRRPFPSSLLASVLNFP